MTVHHLVPNVPPVPNPYAQVGPQPQTYALPVDSIVPPYQQQNRSGSISVAPVNPETQNVHHSLQNLRVTPNPDAWGGPPMQPPPPTLNTATATSNPPQNQPMIDTGTPVSFPRLNFCLVPDTAVPVGKPAQTYRLVASPDTSFGPQSSRYPPEYNWGGVVDQQWVRLPPSSMQGLTFSGEELMEDRKAFQKFMARFCNNTEKLSGANRLHLLKGCLTEGALQLVDHLSLID